MTILNREIHLFWTHKVLLGCLSELYLYMHYISGQTTYRQPTRLWLHDLCLDVLILHFNELQFIWAKVFHLITLTFHVAPLIYIVDVAIILKSLVMTRISYTIPHCKKYSSVLSWLISRKPIPVHAPDM